MKKAFWSAIIVLSLLMSASAGAAPNMVIGNDTIGAGGTASISLLFEADGLTTDLSFDLDYDETNFTATQNCVANVPTETAATASVVCSVVDVGAGDLVVRVAVLPVVAFPIPAIATPQQSLGTISFANIGGTAGNFPVAIVHTPVETEKYFDAGVAVPGSGSTDGQIIVQGAAYASSPTPAQGLNLGSVIQGQTNPTADLVIDNVGATGTTLTGTCAITVNPTVFSVTSGSPFSVPESSATGTVVASCDSTQPIAVHNGTMECTHNGDDTGEASPAVYALVCNITDGPQPVYNSAPAPGAVISMAATEEGSPITNETVTINNNAGASGSSLDGSCGLTGNTPVPISLSGGAFSIPDGGTPSVQTISCDSSAEGNYSATLSCTHNDKLKTSPATYTVNCVVPPAGAAQFRSDPVPGTTTDMTFGMDVAAGGTVPNKALNFFNDAPEPDDSDLGLFCSEAPGDAEITFAPNPLSVDIIPGGSSGVTVSCDATNPGSFSKTYNCDYTVDGSGVPTGDGGQPGTASYTYTCEVRDAEAQVTTTPVSGSTITKQVPSGGTGQFDVLFTENRDENIDGSLITCTLDDDVNFEITSPGAFPAVIPAGGGLGVTVIGTDPGDSETVQTNLNCTFDDSDEGTVDVTYTLVMQIGSVAEFRVTKNFIDNNPAQVRVKLTCDTGLPLVQEFDISEGPGNHVNFVLGAIPEGPVSCMVEEIDGADGYASSFAASGESTYSDDDSGCYFTEVQRGDQNQCAITNTVLPVPIDVTKEWFMDGQPGNFVEPIARVWVTSDAELEGGQSCKIILSAQGSEDHSEYCRTLIFEGPETDTQTIMVYPDWEGTTVYINEDALESEVEMENGCGGSVYVEPGTDDASCTITNTVYFEGIPTLNQYGMAIMVLLMLGVGLLGFRRYS